MASELILFATFLLAGYFIGAEWNLPVAGMFVGAVLFGFLQALRAQSLLSYLRGASETPIIFSGLWKNIYSHIRRLEQTDDHRQSQEFRTLLRFRESVSALPLGIVFLNAHNQVEWFNQAAGQFLDLRDPDDVGRDIGHLLRQPEIAAALQNKTGTTQIALNKKDLSLEVYITYFEHRHFIVVQDMTNFRHLQKIHHELLSDVSHELRSPLTVIQAYAEMLNVGKMIDIREPTREILRHTQDMNGIIDDLISCERLDTEPFSEVLHEEIDMVDLVREVAVSSQKLFADKNCNVKTNFQSEAKIYGNRSELKRALSNLISNALRYSKTDGIVEVSWHTDSQGGHLAVRDYGKGIAAEHIGRLTERFYRVDKDRARDSGGIGLGLAIVKRVLQRHQARLHIESEPDVGSLFRCDFDVAVLRRSSNRNVR